MNWKSQAPRELLSVCWCAANAAEIGLIEIPQAFAGGGKLITARLASDKTQQLQQKSSQQTLLVRRQR